MGEKKNGKQTVEIKYVIQSYGVIGLYYNSMINNLFSVIFCLIFSLYFFSGITNFDEK